MAEVFKVPSDAPTNPLLKMVDLEAIAKIATIWRRFAAALGFSNG